MEYLESRQIVAQHIRQNGDFVGRPLRLEGLLSFLTVRTKANRIDTDPIHLIEFREFVEL